MTSDTLNATVMHRQDLTPELAIVRIRPDTGSVPAFVPGQFCTLGLLPEVSPAPPPEASPPSESSANPAACRPALAGAPVGVLAEGPPPRAVPTLPAPQSPAPAKPAKPKLIRRAYSIASSPNVRDYVELLVVLVKEGRLTPRLWTVEPGGRMFLDPRIMGHFTLAGIPEGKDLIMVSTGTGLAPYMSMLRTYRGTGRWRKLVIVHGARRSCELAYREELEQTAAEDPSLVYVPIVSREPADSPWRGPRGRVQAVLHADHYQRLVASPLDPAQCHVLLCGNPAMISEVEVLLGARGFVTAEKGKPGNVHFERYW